jgi:hypothetical protein
MTFFSTSLATARRRKIRVMGRESWSNGDSWKKTVFFKFQSLNNREF